MYMHPPKHAPNPLLYVGFLVMRLAPGWSCISNRQRTDACSVLKDRVLGASAGC